MIRNRCRQMRGPVSAKTVPPVAITKISIPWAKAISLILAALVNPPPGLALYQKLQLIPPGLFAAS